MTDGRIKFPALAIIPQIDQTREDRGVEIYSDMMHPKAVRIRIGGMEDAIAAWVDAEQLIKAVQAVMEGR